MNIIWPNTSLLQYTLTGAGERSYLEVIAIKIAYVLLHQVDLALTMLATTLGLSEMNPFMLNILDVPLLLIVTKMLIPFLLAWIIPHRFLIPATLFMFLVVSWNVKELILFFL